MLYLDNITEPQTVFIPKSYSRTLDGDLLLRICGNVTKRTDLLEDSTGGAVAELAVFVCSHCPASAGYHVLTVTLPEGLCSGEYSYELQAGPKVVSSGLLSIAEQPGSAIHYDEKITYHQYEE